MENRGAPKLSVVIATYNRRDLLLRTLESLAQQTLPRHEFEVLVVVDGSTDDTVERLRLKKTPAALRIFEQQNRGQAAARNVGIREALAPVILFLDDDITCSPTLLAEHLAAQVASPGAVVFGPTLVSDD